jgi:hypothetical protein
MLTSEIRSAAPPYVPTTVPIYCTNLKPCALELKVISGCARSPAKLAIAMNRPRHDAEHCTNNSNENKLHKFFELAGFGEDNYMQICDNIGEESDHALSGCTSTK